MDGERIRGGGRKRKRGGGRQRKVEREKEERERGGGEIERVREDRGSEREKGDAGWKVLQVTSPRFIGSNIIVMVSI